MSNDSMAVAVQQPQQGVTLRAAGLLRPIAPTGEIIAAQNEARAFIASALEKGRDYGVIPGTGDKATLLKPGSERICAGFGVRVVPEIVEMEVDHDREVSWRKRKKKWNNAFKGDKSFTWEEESGVSYGLYRYVVRANLFQIDTGLLLGSGIGSASTMEGKYVDRPRESENTVLKIAKKRAQIDGTLTTFGLSDQFTQDLDDFREDFTHEPVEARAVEVLPDDAPQLVDLRALAAKIGRKTAAWLEGEVRNGIRAEAVPDIYRMLNERLQAKEAKARDAEANPAVVPGGVQAGDDADDAMRTLFPDGAP